MIRTSMEHEPILDYLERGQRYESMIKLREALEI